ncbi:hypothetical protein MCUN1_000417 [Malassezia cuniculi]|uniref:Fork-head domain-containing protein n=1 Tax=Malassezia cuniculi TaxID=948313 RepID=A0AAF0ER75_9BASI|nr:hypothetical protein MCUN1_000417 [Malassezia cuniculi]
MGSHQHVHTPRSTSASGGGQKRLNWAEMICYTLSESPSGHLVIQDLFESMCIKFPEVRDWALGKDWEARVKNRIKSTLSIKSNLFVKVPRPSNASGKGSWWTLSAEAKESYRQGRISEIVRGTPNSSSISPTIAPYNPSNSGTTGRQISHSRRVQSMSGHNSPLQSPAPSPFPINIGTSTVGSATPKIAQSAPAGYDISVESPIVSKSVSPVNFTQQMPTFDMYTTQSGSPQQLQGPFPIDNSMLPMSQSMVNMPGFPLGFGNAQYGQSFSDTLRNGGGRPFYNAMNDQNGFYAFGALSEQNAPVASPSPQVVRPQSQPQTQSLPHQQPQQHQQPQSPPQGQPQAQMHHQVQQQNHTGQDPSQVNTLNNRALFTSMFNPMQLNGSVGFDQMQYNPFGITTGFETGVTNKPNTSNFSFDMSGMGINGQGTIMNGAHTQGQASFAMYNSSNTLDIGNPFMFDTGDQTKTSVSGHILPENTRT